MSCCNSNCNHDPCGSSFNQALTKAAQYAQYAQTQANKAEDLWLEFNALYLGAFAIAPTQDNQGNPLQEGALYFNSTSNQMFVWQGGSWIDFDFDEFTPFLATGTTNARNLVTRFKDVINVKDFGAVGDGVADDTAAIQAAIDANPGKAIYFPAGEYLIYDTIKITKTYTSLISDFMGCAFIKLMDGTKPAAIEVKSNVVGGGVFGFNFINLYLAAAPTSNYQIGIILEKASGTRILNSEIGGFGTCLDIRGGVNSFYSGLRLSAFGTTGNYTSKGIIQIGKSTYGATQSGFTHMFQHILAGADARTENIVRIRAADVVTFQNCYWGGATNANVDIDSTNDQIGGLFFDNVVSDGVAFPPNALHTPYGILVSGAYFATSFIVNGGSFYAHRQAIKVNTNNTDICDITCTGTAFASILEYAINIDANRGNLTASGCVFSDNNKIGAGWSYPNGGAIYIADAAGVVITGNSFVYRIAESFPNTTKAIQLNGTINSTTITGNAFTTNPTFPNHIITDFVNSATIQNLSIGNNASDNPTNTIVGSIIGNQENANPKSLDWYEENTFTPILTFGSGSTGITYSDRQGNYTRIGNRVIFDIYIVLTSKGSSVGAVGIGGIPFPLAPSATARANASVSIQRIDGIGTANVDAVFPSVLGLKLVYINGTGDPIDLTDANFRNNTQLWISGTYQAA